MDLNAALGAFSGIPADWLVLAALFIIIAADALRAGSIRAAALSLSFPVAALLFKLIPQTLFLGSLSAQFPALLAQAIIFLIIEVVLFVCAHQMLASFDRYTSLFSAAVSGFAAVIVVLVIWLQVPALQSLWHFDPQIQSIFGSAYGFFWIIAAYLALAFVGS